MGCKVVCIGLQETKHISGFPYKPSQPTQPSQPSQARQAKPAEPSEVKPSEAKAASPQASRSQVSQPSQASQAASQLNRVLRQSAGPGGCQKSGLGWTGKLPKKQLGEDRGAAEKAVGVGPGSCQKFTWVDQGGVKKSCFGIARSIMARHAPTIHVVHYNCNLCHAASQRLLIQQLAHVPFKAPVMAVQRNYLK